MNRKRRAFRPSASPLEPKLLLSQTMAPWVGRGVTPVATPYFASKPQPVNTITGRYGSGQQDNRPADEPLQVGLDASGWVKGLGCSRLAGALDLGGFRMSNQDATGTVVLSNGRGTVNIRLTGTGGNGPIAGETLHFSAVVESGTGVYRKFHRTGTADVTFGPNQISGVTGSFAPIAGTLSIKLNLRPTGR